MAYFNGYGFTDLSGKWQYEATTAIYCDNCAETEIPLPPLTASNRGRRHWDTGFKWVPYYGGDKRCICCSKVI